MKIAVGEETDPLPSADDGKNKAARELGRLGGAARAKIQCYVLDDGRRVISQRGMNAALQRAESGSISRRKPVDDAAGNLPSFLYPKNIIPFVSSDLALSATSPLEFKLPEGNAIGHGYPAELLPEVCSVWMQAKDTGVLTPAQMKTAAAASPNIAA